MTLPFLAITIFVALLMVLPLYRVVAGPTVFDRVIAASLIGVHSLLLLVLLGFVYGRIEMFVDLAIVYALLNFVVVVATAKFLEKKRQGQ